MTSIPIFCRDRTPEVMSGFGVFLKRQVRNVKSATTGVISDLSKKTSNIAVSSLKPAKIEKINTTAINNKITQSKNLIFDSSMKFTGSDYQAIKPIIKLVMDAWIYLSKKDPAWAKNNVKTVESLWFKTGDVWFNNVRYALQPFNINLRDAAMRMTTPEINVVANQIMTLKAAMTGPGFINNATTISNGYRRGVALFDAKIATLNKLAGMPRVKPGEEGGLPYIGKKDSAGGAGLFGKILPIAAAGLGAWILLKG